MRKNLIPLPAPAVGSPVLHIEVNPVVSARAMAKALRFMASTAEFMSCSPDCDPEVKSAVCALQAQLERSATQLDTATAA